MSDYPLPYVPTIIEFEDAGCAEFIMRDTFAVYIDRPDGTALIVDQHGEPIGFRWPLGWYADKDILARGNLEGTQS